MNNKIIRQFLADFLPLIEGDEGMSIYDACRKYSREHHTYVDWDNGCTRDIIIVPDLGFVIKLNNSYTWKQEEWGANYDEYKFYRKAKRDGYDYLFAEMRKVKYNHHFYYAMEYVCDIDCDRDFNDYTDYYTKDEDRYIHIFGSDIHGGNFGFNDNGEIKIIDYASFGLR